MRAATLSVGLLVLSTTAYAQSPCAPASTSYDPYKPTNIAIMRDFGGALMAQAPISTLLKLDPYVPSQAELLRQVGRGIPLWTAYPWHGASPVIAAHDCGEVDRSAANALSAASPAPAPMTRLADVLAVLPRDRAPAPPGTASTRPADSERTQGVSIQYAGRTWVSAGRAVPYREADFVLAGQSAGTSVFRRAGEKDNVIYVASIQGMVAPFRAVR